MNLYLICHVDTDAGHNMDLFVRCDTPEEAIDLWRIYFEGWFPDNDEDNSVMGLEKDPPDALPDHVFLVPEGVQQGVLKWHEDVKTVETRYHAVEAAKQALGVSSA